MGPRADLKVTADVGARAWLDAHPTTGPRVISYDVKRCCGGGKLCLVGVRNRNAGDARADFVPAVLEDGTELLVDRRAAARLPDAFGLTVRRFGPLRCLDLDLDPDQWGTLLYD